MSSARWLVPVVSALVGALLGVLVWTALPKTWSVGLDGIPISIPRTADGPAGEGDRGADEGDRRADEGDRAGGDGVTADLGSAHGSPLPEQGSTALVALLGSPSFAEAVAPPSSAGDPTATGPQIEAEVRSGAVSVEIRSTSRPDAIAAAARVPIELAASLAADATLRRERLTAASEARREPIERESQRIETGRTADIERRALAAAALADPGTGGNGTRATLRIAELSAAIDRADAALIRLDAARIDELARLASEMATSDAGAPPEVVFRPMDAMTISSTPQPLFPVLAFAAFGGAGGLLWLVWSGRRRMGLVDDTAAGRHLANVAVLATVPESARGRRLTESDVIDGSAGGGFDRVVSQLGLVPGASPAPVLAVTSARHPDCVGATAVALAESLVAAGHDVALVSTWLGPLVNSAEERTSGLAAVLEGRATMDSAAYTLADAPAAAFRYLPPGELRADLGRLMRGPRFHTLLRRLCDDGTIVLLECGPILSNSSALAAMATSDLAVLSAVRGETAQLDLREAADQVERAGVAIAGLVLHREIVPRPPFRGNGGGRVPSSGSDTKVIS